MPYNKQKCNNLKKKINEACRNLNRKECERNVPIITNEFPKGIFCKETRDFAAGTAICSMDTSGYNAGKSYVSNVYPNQPCQKGGSNADNHMTQGEGCKKNEDCPNNPFSETKYVCTIVAPATTGICTQEGGTRRRRRSAGSARRVTRRRRSAGRSVRRVSRRRRSAGRGARVTRRRRRRSRQSGGKIAHIFQPHEPEGDLCKAGLNLSGNGKRLTADYNFNMNENKKSKWCKNKLSGVYLHDINVATNGKYFHPEAQKLIQRSSICCTDQM